MMQTNYDCECEIVVLPLCTTICHKLWNTDGKSSELGGGGRYALGGLDSLHLAARIKLSSIQGGGGGRMSGRRKGDWEGDLRGTDTQLSDKIERGRRSNDIPSECEYLGTLRGHNFRLLTFQITHTFINLFHPQLT